MASDNNSLLTNPSWPSLYNPRSELFDIQHHDPIQPGGFYLVNPQDVFRFTLYWTLTFYIPVFFVFGSYAFLNLTFPPKKDQKRAFKSFGGIHEEAEIENGVEEDYVAEEEEEDSEGAEDTYPMSPISPYTRPPPHRRASRNGYYDTLRSEITANSTSTAATASPPSGYLKSPTSATATHPFLPVSSAHVYPPPAASLAIGNTSKKINKPFQGKPEKPTKPKNAARSRITFALLVFFGFLLLSLIGAVVSSAIVGYILTGLYKAGNFYMSTWVPFLWAAISVMVGMLNVWPSVINLI